MASRASARVAHVACCEVVETSVEDLAIEARAHARPGCRVAVLGIRLLPWSWGFALNAFTLARAHRYFTSFRGLRKPWAQLEKDCPGLKPSRHFHLGTSYLAVGGFSEA